VILTARAAVVQSIAEPGEYMGFPARPSFEAKKILLLTLKLPELFARLKKLEKRAGDQ
jgi:UDP-3-O-[3-hydroxymyristoyl] glucosamine N-acyltransferase